MTLSLFGCGAIGRLKAVKNAKCGGNFVPNAKAAPQFALANEEPAYRSATQQLPAICVFYARVRT